MNNPPAPTKTQIREPINKINAIILHVSLESITMNYSVKINFFGLRDAQRISYINNITHSKISMHRNFCYQRKHTKNAPVIQYAPIGVIAHPALTTDIA